MQVENILSRSSRSATALLESASSRRKSASAPYVFDSTVWCASYLVVLAKRAERPFLLASLGMTYNVHFKSRQCFYLGTKHALRSISKHLILAHPRGANSQP